MRRSKARRLRYKRIDRPRNSLAGCGKNTFGQSARGEFPAMITAARMARCSTALCHLPSGDGNHGGRRGDAADGDLEGQLTGGDVGDQHVHLQEAVDEAWRQAGELEVGGDASDLDRKSTRLNSSHLG